MRRIRWRWRLLAGALLLAVLVVAHAPLARLLASLLVIDDPLQPTDAVIVMGASGPYQAVPFAEAAALYRDGYAHSIVLIENRASRLVQAGVVPTLELVGRTRLAAEGVPDSALTVLAGADRTAWDGARRLRDWLAEHPGATATVLCGEFDSRLAAGIAREVLGPDAARLRWKALPDRRYGVGNWWTTRQGILQIVGAYVTLAHANLFGEPEPAERWDPDAYERALVGPTKR